MVIRVEALGHLGILSSANPDNNEPALEMQGIDGEIEGHHPIGRKKAFEVCRLCLQEWCHRRNR